jgi:hypothetical protein
MTRLTRLTLAAILALSPLILGLFLALSPVAASASVHQFWEGIWKGRQGGAITRSPQQGPSGNDPWFHSVGNKRITSGAVEIGSDRPNAFFRVGTRDCTGCTFTFKLNGETFSTVKATFSKPRVESAKVDVKAGDKMEVTIAGADKKGSDWAVFCLYYDGKQPRDIRQAPRAKVSANASTAKPKGFGHHLEKQAKRIERAIARDRHEAKGGKKGDKK